MKKVSVVTTVLCPSEKALVVLSACMKSVKKAIEKVHGEYIIVNDNSAVGEEFFKDIADIYIKNAETLGVSKSLNAGMRRGTGEFLVKLDSDYLVPENIFEILLKDWSDDCCFISPSYLGTHPDNTHLLDIAKLPKAEGGLYQRPPGLAPRYLKKPSNYEWGGGILMFDAAKLRGIDYFDEGFGIGGAQDNDVIYRLLMKGYNWKWDNNVVTRHFASVSSTDEKSTQDWRAIRQLGVDYFVKKHGFEPGGFISRIYGLYGYKFEY